MRTVALVLACQLLIGGLGWGFWYAYQQGRERGIQDGRQLQYQIMDRALILACRHNTPIEIDSRRYVCRKEAKL